MANDENIVSYTAEEIAAMRARGEDLTDWARVDAKSDAEIAADTASDPSWDGIPEDWYEHAIPLNGALSRHKDFKRAVQILFDADVVECFERDGEGWQDRMNAAPRVYIELRG
jgi:uncharacterized protein (DUF4415 family)